MSHFGREDPAGFVVEDDVTQDFTGSEGNGRQAPDDWMENCYFPAATESAGTFQPSTATYGVAPCKASFE